MRTLFHVELRQFPGVGRAFNLTAEELSRRFVGPWIAGEVIELDDRRYAPERARLTVYEGPELRPEEIGMGRGWANVTRSGSDVTERVLESGRDPSLQQLEQELLERVPLTPPEVVALANERWPGRRASERLGLAELAVWELLHQQRVGITRAGQAVQREDWEQIVLSWETWSGERGSGLLLVSL